MMNDPRAPALARTNGLINYQRDWSLPRPPFRYFLFFFFCCLFIKKEVQKRYIYLPAASSAVSASCDRMKCVKLPPESSYLLDTPVFRAFACRFVQSIEGGLHQYLQAFPCLSCIYFLSIFFFFRYLLFLFDFFTLLFLFHLSLSCCCCYYNFFLFFLPAYLYILLGSSISVRLYPTGKWKRLQDKAVGIECESISGRIKSG